MACIPSTNFKNIRKFLMCCGFVERVGSGRGGHDKFVHPTNSPIAINLPRCVMVPRHNITKRLAREIRKEVKWFGVDEQVIERCCLATK